MPELPDITVYVEALDKHLGGRVLENVRLASPFLLRSVEPPLSAVRGKRLIGVERSGKRIILAFEESLFLVIHLMIAGRLRLRPAGQKMPGKLGLACFDFTDATLLFTEASKKKRASLHVVAGRRGLAAFSRGGLDVFAIDSATFAARLRSENHTLKRSLTDPRMLDGIGNAYSDEILHRARLSPMALTSRLDDPSFARLHEACGVVLQEWIDRTRAQVGDGFPEEVTAFRSEMAVHGKYGKPCPVCKTPVQRIRYADNETNYCPGCQTDGKLLADRSLSRLLKSDWPKSLEELDDLKADLRARVGGDGGAD